MPTVGHTYLRVHPQAGNGSRSICIQKRSNEDLGLILIHSYNGDIPWCMFFTDDVVLVDASGV